MMSNDYQMYMEKKNDIQNLTYDVYVKFNPYIMKYAIRCEKISKGNYERHDFSMDVYEELYKQISFIDEEKIINKEAFSFFVFVKQAYLKVLNKYIKSTKYELIEDDSTIESNVNSINDVINEISIKEFYSKLTKRQKVILNYRQKGLEINVIAKKLKVAYGTIHRDIFLSKNIFEQMFHIKANKFIMK